MTREQRDAQWKSVLEQYERSELSTVEFCKLAGVSRTSLQRRLDMLETQVGEGQFLSIGPAPDNTEEPAKGVLVVELPYGVVLRFTGLPN